MSKPKIYMTMLGAAGDEVTGSSTLLKIVYDKRTSYGLIDAGIVQGKSEIRNFSYPVLAENLDFVILTHAHADHKSHLRKRTESETDEYLKSSSDMPLSGIPAELQDSLPEQSDPARTRKYRQAAPD